jgi:hypothetical protein
MKTYVSYVVQDKNGHTHESEIVTTPSPPYTFSPDPEVDDIMHWADKKRKELKNDESLVILNIFKL